MRVDGIGATLREPRVAVWLAAKRLAGAVRFPSEIVGDIVIERCVLRTYRDGEVPRAPFAMRACWRSDGSDGRGVRDHRHTRGRGPLGGVGELGEEESVEEGVEGKCNQARRADRDVVLSGSVGGARRQQKVHSGTHFGDHAIAIQ